MPNEFPNVTNDMLRVVRLCHGAGNGVSEACAMTASNMLIGRPEDGDNNHCVCRVIRDFIVVTNDKMPIEYLSQLYSPLLYEILGTRTEDEAVLDARRRMIADWVIRELVPMAMGIIGHKAVAGFIAQPPFFDEAKDLSDQIGIVKARCQAACDCLNDLYGSQDLTESQVCFAGKVLHLVELVVRDLLAYTADLSYDVGRILRDISERHMEPLKVWEKCPQIIRDMAAIGDKRPVEPAITDEELCEALGVC